MRVWDLEIGTLPSCSPCDVCVSEYLLKLMNLPSILSHDASCLNASLAHVLISTKLVSLRNCSNNRFLRSMLPFGSSIQ